MIRTAILFLWLVANLLLKLSSLISFVAGLIVLGTSLIFVLIGRDGFGLRLTTYAFGFFVIGTLRYLIEIRNEKN